METKKQSLKEKLEKIIFDWVPADNNKLRRQPDENKIDLVLDLFSQQKQEIVIKGYKQAIKDVESLYGEPFDDMIADLYENLERLEKPTQTKTN